MAIVIKLFEHDPEKREVEVPKNENVLICRYDPIGSRMEPEASLGLVLDFVVRITTKAGRKISSYSISVLERSLSDLKIYRAPTHYYLITAVLEPIE